MTTTPSQTTAFVESREDIPPPPPPPPLIDVDCNLWHDDLQSLLSTLSPESSEPASNTDPTTSTPPFPLTILTEDAVQESNVVAMITPSTTLLDAERGILTLLQRQQQPRAEGNHRPPILRTTVGVHPYHVRDEELQGKNMSHYMDRCRQLLEQYPTLCAAVGECGLDASEGFPPMEEQIPWFQAQIDLAQQLHRPLFVHERLAHEKTLDLLQHCNVTETPILIHCFTGTPAECAVYIERGYFISLSGFLCKDTVAARDIGRCLQEGLIPLPRLMIETDAPYMGFAGCRDLYMTKNEALIQQGPGMNAKKRKRLLQSIYPNVPSALVLVLRRVLHHLNVGRQERGEPLLTEHELAQWTTRNANQFFQFGLEQNG